MSRAKLYAALGVLALVGVGYLGFTQLQQAKVRLAERLNQVPNLTFGELSLGVWPSPQLRIDNVRYQFDEHQLRASEVALSIDWWRLLTLQETISAVLVNNGQWWQHDDVQAEQIRVHIEDIDPKNYVFGKVQLQGYYGENPIAMSGWVQRFNNGVKIHQGVFRLSRASYRETLKSFALEARELSVAYQPSGLQLFLQQGALNQMTIDKAVVNVLSHQAGAPSLEVALYQQGGKLLLRERSENARVISEIEGDNLALAPWFTFFDRPVIVQGRADVNGKIERAQRAPLQGEMQLTVHNATANSLNLLDILGQYVPVKYYAADKLKEKQLPLDTLRVNLDWTGEQLYFRQMQGQNALLALNGAGKVNLDNHQCLFELKLNPTRSDITQLSLPLSLFGQCNALQYKVRLDKALSQELKNKAKAWLEKQEQK
ncbi:hypothetical protein HPC38_05165 [Pasteurellaceae bacterium HPA106]|uniref:hypothetical protein n=1 Tax=Spirabiliibacterium pneumoniae TaxID=221400 RepID=UPI001AAE0DDD|nr:hypothetical protein [Spirabiliibacterium pneumoniae]MBE2896264.1 hypothetical protein [Spirabiliibacterium pneumoniae]